MASRGSVGPPNGHPRIADRWALWTGPPNSRRFKLSRQAPSTGAAAAVPRAAHASRRPRTNGAGRLLTEAVVTAWTERQSPLTAASSGRLRSCTLASSSSGSRRSPAVPRPATPQSRTCRMWLNRLMDQIQMAPVVGHLGHCRGQTRVSGRGPLLQVNPRGRVYYIRTDAGSDNVMCVDSGDGKVCVCFYVM